jgi:hypothetical protein
MVPRSRDNRLTGEPRKRILHGLMQGCVKALNTPFRRRRSAALRGNLQPGQPASDTATFSRVKP